VDGPRRGGGGSWLVVRDLRFIRGEKLNELREAWGLGEADPEPEPEPQPQPQPRPHPEDPQPGRDRLDLDRLDLDRLDVDRRQKDVVHEDQRKYLARQTLGVKEAVNKLMEEERHPQAPPRFGPGPAEVGDALRRQLEGLNDRINRLHKQREVRSALQPDERWSEPRLNSLQEQLKQLSRDKGIPVDTWFSEPEYD
tara:strand:+ start:705 stop:1292 length:588 start_codon:yes stop_codon:yes gene_type:complete